MKYFTWALILVFVLSLSSESIAASEPEPIPASMVDPGNEDSVRAFVERAKVRLDRVGLVGFRGETRVEGDPWKHGTTYLHYYGRQVFHNSRVLSGS
jgi:hypothetical protein